MNATFGWWVLIIVINKAAIALAFWWHSAHSSSVQPGTAGFISPPGSGASPSKALRKNARCVETEPESALHLEQQREIDQDVA